MNNNKKIVQGLLIIPPMIAVFLGWIDYETRSLFHLFSKPGNLVALLFYTVLFQLVGCIFISAYFLLKLFKNSKRS